MHDNDLSAMWTFCMPARNLQMIAYRTRVRDSSYDDKFSHLPRGVRTHKATWESSAQSQRIKGHASVSSPFWC